MLYAEAELHLHLGNVSLTQRDHTYFRATLETGDTLGKRRDLRTQFGPIDGVEPAE